MVRNDSCIAEGLALYANFSQVLYLKKHENKSVYGLSGGGGKKYNPVLTSIGNYGL